MMTFLLHPLNASYKQHQNAGAIIVRQNQTFRTLLILLFFITTSSLLYAKPLKVVVSIAPLKTFVTKIGGSRVEVQVMVNSGFDPHIYEPKVSQLRDLSKASLYFSIGTEFDQIYLPRFKNLNKNIIFVHSDKNIKKRFNESSFPDPHVWLSPLLVKEQAQNIFEALLRVDPEYEQSYQKNLDLFIEEIDELNQIITKILEGIDETIVVSHGTWGYFTDQYGLKQLAIEHEGETPGPAYLVKLIKQLRAMNIQTIFVGPGSSQSQTKLVAKSIGASLQLIDPLSEDWKQNLIHFATMIRNSATSGTQVK